MDALTFYNALITLEESRGSLTPQQYKTLRGLEKIMERRRRSHENTT